ncbi:MAG TPA: hypothetical protein VL240_13090 [Candidatus Binatia bacterium]|nr:hypothetical protein [Candidatus Binatia bacterium]
MDLLLRFLRWEVWLFLLGLASIVTVQLLNGQINTRSLLSSNNGNMAKSGDISPARLQLLISTLGLAFYYLVQVLNNPNPGTFPSIPESWPTVLGGSHVIYLGGKAYSRWFSNDGNG